MRRTISVVTAFVILASFSLATAEALQVEGSAMAKTGGLSAELCCLFSGQAEEPALLANTGDDNNSPDKADSQRLFGLWRANGSRTACYISHFKTGPKEGFVSLKDTILLKLRI